MLTPEPKAVYREKQPWDYHNNSRISVLTPEPKAVYRKAHERRDTIPGISVLTPEPKAVYSAATRLRALVMADFSAHP